MKLKVDENLPASLIPALAGLDHEVESVEDEGLAGVVDERVWEACQAEGRFLITQDLDFSDLRQYAPGTHFGILLVRLRNPGRLALRRRVQALFETEDVEGWQRCLVVASETKLRVRRP